MLFMVYESAYYRIGMYMYIQYKYVYRYFLYLGVATHLHCSKV